MHVHTLGTMAAGVSSSKRMLVVLQAHCMPVIRCRLKYSCYRGLR